MSFYNYSIIPNYLTGSDTLNLPQPTSIKDCEDALSFTFESGYVDFITKYGEGILGGTYIRIYLPTKIAEGHNDWLSRISEYYFWDEGKDILTKEQVQQAVCIGDTFDGDEIIYLQNNYYILPRHEETIFKTGETLAETIEWLCSADVLTESFDERNFEPFNEHNA